jgi:ankyrin repeat protein
MRLSNKDLLMSALKTELQNLSSEEINHLVDALRRGDHVTATAFMAEHETYSILAARYKGRYLLQWAVEEGNIDALRLFKDYGIDIQASIGFYTHDDFPSFFNDNGTAFMLACALGKEDVAKFLLHAGADVNRTSLWGVQTALKLAAAAGSKPIVRLLLENGAKDFKNIHSSETAAEIAARHGYHGIADLISNWADIRKKELKEIADEKHRRFLKNTDFGEGLQKPIPMPPQVFKKKRQQ